MSRIRSIVAILGLAAGLSACGGGDGTSGTATPPVVVPAPALEDQFGAGFGTRYRVAANTKATDPLAADLNPVSLTTDPVTI